MGWLGRFLSEILPKELTSDYASIKFKYGDRSYKLKRFKGGPELYRFEFIPKQDTEFIVKIGKALGNVNRFAGETSPNIEVKGRKSSTVMELQGSKFNLEKGDEWLVKVKARNFIPNTSAVLEIYLNCMD